MAPAVPGLIDRDDLVAALDRAAVRKVTIIAAPAGSGKTSLLRSWADRFGQARQLAVLQVPRDQQDTQQFWLALLDVVRASAANVCAFISQARHTRTQAFPQPVCGVPVNLFVNRRRRQNHAWSADLSAFRV